MQKKNPVKDVSLGWGLAEKAKKLLQGRKQQIDDEVEGKKKKKKESN